MEQRPKPREVAGRNHPEGQGERMVILFSGRGLRTWADVLAEDGGGDLKDDVADVKDGQAEVVVRALHAEVLLEARQARVSWTSLSVSCEKQLRAGRSWVD